MIMIMIIISGKHH